MNIHRHYKKNSYKNKTYKKLNLNRDEIKI